MAAIEPFLPEVKPATAGETQSIAIGAGSAISQTVVASAFGTQPSMLVQFLGATAGTIAYVRLSVESTIPAATITDTPMLAGAVRLFATPNPTGSNNISVIVSATPTTAGTLFITLGQGGV